MLSAEDPIFKKVSDALYLLSENREIAEQCLRMQEAAAERKRWENMQEQIVEMEKELAEKRQALAESNSALAETNNALAETNNALAEKDAELERLRAQLREYQKQRPQD